MQTYLFYDLETTGLNKVFDQPLQFAAIRTDPNFKELERSSIYITLRPDVVPSPKALLTHGISVFNSQNSICEYEAVRKIHALLNHPGTISIGYNNLGFDDEFLRFAFHRNLLPPYTHQFKNGCLRMDLYPITIAFSLYKQEALNWPEVDGKPSLKLENLSRANSLAKGPAHDALVDVEAALALAKQLSKHDKMWDYLLGYFNKDTDQERIHKLPTAFQSGGGIHQFGLLLGTGFFSENGYQVPVLSIGASVPYKNQTLWLALDDPQLLETKPDTIADTSRVVRKKMGETGFLLPPHNRFTDQLNPTILKTTHRNIQWLQQNPALFQEIVHYHQHYRYPEVPNLDVDAALYSMGFPSKDEADRFRQFHDVTLMEKQLLISGFKRRDYRELARRILFRNYPEISSKSLYHDLKILCKKVNPEDEAEAMLDYMGRPRLTVKGANQIIEEIIKNESPNDKERGLLSDLTRYLEVNFPPD